MKRSKKGAVVRRPTLSLHFCRIEFLIEEHCDEEFFKTSSSLFSYKKNWSETSKRVAMRNMFLMRSLIIVGDEL